MRRALVTLALLAAGCNGADDAADTTTSPATSPAGSAATVTITLPTSDTPAATPAEDPAAPDGTAPVVLPEGFARVQATVTELDGTVCEVCLWLAADADQRRRGLMFVTELGPADGMAFLYPAARTGNFWMKNTVLPLSIAFYGPTGEYLSSFDMEPCTADPCPLYRTAPDFLIAVETVQGGLDRLGMVPGSVLAITDLPCDD